jgi:methyltransferase (TIGR00027 family)
LSAAGLDPAAPTAWLAEGLVPYLSPADNDRLVAGITGLSAAGSRLAVEYINADFAHVPDLMENIAADITEWVRDLWKGGVGGDPVEWLNRHGWIARTDDPVQLARSYRRAPAPMFESALGAGLTPPLFVTATLPVSG